MTFDPGSATPPLQPRNLVRWLVRLGRDVVDEYREDDVGDLAASITFWSLLSIPATVLALVSALGSLDSIVGANLAADVEREVLDFVDRTFADESSSLANAVSDLFATSSGGVFTIALVVAMYSLSRGFAGVIRSLDRAYEVNEGRSWVHLRLVGLGLGAGSVVSLAGGATLLAIIPTLPGAVVLRWLIVPAALALMVVWAATIYHVGPHHRTPWRYDLPGAFVTTIGWVLATQGFAVYVRLGSQGNQVQTTVGAVLLALTLLHALSVVLLVGAEVNDVIARRARVVERPISRSERKSRR